MNQKATSAAGCLPLTCQISAKHRTIYGQKNPISGAGQSTANSESPQQEQPWSFVTEQKLLLGQLLFSKQQCLKASRLLPPFPQPCSGWPGASAGPRCGGHTSSCPSWSSLWSWAGVSLPRSGAGNENQEMALMRSQAVIPGSSHSHRIVKLEKTSKIIKFHLQPRAARSTTKPCP